MHVAAKRKLLDDQAALEYADLSRYVPEKLAKLDDPQTAIPRIAKDAEAINLIERAIVRFPPRIRYVTGMPALCRVWHPKAFTSS